MQPRLIYLVVTAAWTLTSAVPQGENTCQGVIKHPVTVRVNVTEPVTYRTYMWCPRWPPRCSKYVVKMKERVKIMTEMHNRTITVCCRGFVEMEARCVPACPPMTECPNMHCNRTNHCYCSPGYQGVFCNDPCSNGFWGKDCKKQCDCPRAFTCHHLTGDCMLDESKLSVSKTTIRRAFMELPSTQETSPTTVTKRTTEYPTVRLPKMPTTPQIRTSPTPMPSTSTTIRTTELRTDSPITKEPTPSTQTTTIPQPTTTTTMKHATNTHLTVATEPIITKITQSLTTTSQPITTVTQPTTSQIATTTTQPTTTEPVLTFKGTSVEYITGMTITVPPKPTHPTIPTVATTTSTTASTTKKTTTEKPTFVPIIIPFFPFGSPSTTTTSTRAPEVIPEENKFTGTNWNSRENNFTSPTIIKIKPSQPSSAITSSPTIFSKKEESISDQKLIPDNAKIALGEKRNFGSVGLLSNYEITSTTENSASQSQSTSNNTPLSGIYNRDPTIQNNQSGKPLDNQMHRQKMLEAQSGTASSQSMTKREFSVTADTNSTIPAQRTTKSSIIWGFALPDENEDKITQIKPSQNVWPNFSNTGTTTKTTTQKSTKKPVMWQFLIPDDGSVRLQTDPPMTPPKIFVPISYRKRSTTIKPTTPMRPLTTSTPTTLSSSGKPTSYGSIIFPITEKRNEFVEMEITVTSTPNLYPIITKSISSSQEHNRNESVAAIHKTEDPYLFQEHSPPNRFTSQPAITFLTHTTTTTEANLETSSTADPFAGIPRFFEIVTPRKKPIESKIGSPMITEGQKKIKFESDFNDWQFKIATTNHPELSQLFTISKETKWNPTVATDQRVKASPFTPNIQYERSEAESNAFKTTQLPLYTGKTQQVFFDQKSIIPDSLLPAMNIPTIPGDNRFNDLSNELPMVPQGEDPSTEKSSFSFVKHKEVVNLRQTTLQPKPVTRDDFLNLTYILNSIPDFTVNSKLEGKGTSGNEKVGNNMKGKTDRPSTREALPKVQPSQQLQGEIAKVHETVKKKLNSGVDLLLTGATAERKEESTIPRSPEIEESDEEEDEDEEESESTGSEEDDEVEEEEENEEEEDETTPTADQRKKPFRRKEIHQTEFAVNMSQPLVATLNKQNNKGKMWLMGVLIAVGCALLAGTMISAGFLFIHYKRRKEKLPVPMEPCIMAYEPSSHQDQYQLYSVPRPSIDPDIFFCPTFTNSLAEKINKELREMAYADDEISKQQIFEAVVDIK